MSNNPRLNKQTKAFQNFAYDANGNRLSQNQEVNRTRRFSYTPNSNTLTGIKYYHRVDENTTNVTKELLYSYDNMGNLVKDQKHDYSYDGRNRLVAIDQNVTYNYNNNRDYNPVTGRYIQSDPIGFDGGVNGFGYVGGMPIVATDLEGLLIKRCSRELGSPLKPSIWWWEPLRHDYIVVNQTNYSFQAGGNILWSDGVMKVNDEDSNRDGFSSSFGNFGCVTLWSDDLHDQYVIDKAESIRLDPPTYGIGWQATDCQEVADEIIEYAENQYQIYWGNWYGI